MQFLNSTCPKHELVPFLSPMVSISHPAGGSGQIPWGRASLSLPICHKILWVSSLTYPESADFSPCHHLCCFHPGQNHHRHSPGLLQESSICHPTFVLALPTLCTHNLILAKGYITSSLIRTLLLSKHCPEFPSQSE